MRLPHFLRLVGLCIACLGARGGAAEPVRIVAFGDSTTAPRGNLVVYATLLERALNQTGSRPVSVINAGKGGNTTAAARQRFDADVLAGAPHLVIIQFGINDSTVDVWKTPPASASRVSLENYQANLRHFVMAARAAGAEVVLMTPNPLRWTPGLRKKYGHSPYDPVAPDGFNVVLANYAEAVRALAGELKVPLVDVARAHGAQAGMTDTLLLDGMHPNQAGHDLVAGLLVELLRRETLLSKR